LSALLSIFYFILSRCLSRAYKSVSDCIITIKNFDSSPHIKSMIEIKNFTDNQLNLMIRNSESWCVCRGVPVEKRGTIRWWRYRVRRKRKTCQPTTTA